MISRRSFLVNTGVFGIMSGLLSADKLKASKDIRPNILFVIGDDFGWPYASSYGCEAVKTPSFERVAKEGALFENAFVTSPSCTPSRASILTGQYHWRLGESVSLHGTLDPKHVVFTRLLKAAGYHVGYTAKGYGPGEAPGNPLCKSYNKHRTSPPAKQIGNSDYSANFEEFLSDRADDMPFFFWFGCHEPHRGYEYGSGVRNNVDTEKIKVPAYLPDVPEVRKDIADYLFEIEWLDRHLGQMIAKLEAIGELKDTIIVVTGDNGMPFPRAKANLYDAGVHVPLAVRWGDNIAAGRRIKDFVSLQDLAPTFLEAAGLSIPVVMTGKSFLKVLKSKGSGQIDPERTYVVVGKERHTPAQEKPSIAGYPQRAIRTEKWLYIRNYEPERWPAGAPERATREVLSQEVSDREGTRWAYTDADAGPTKTFIIDHRKEPEHKNYFKWCFGKRCAEELYDLSKDPYQLKNLADEQSLKTVKRDLEERLNSILKETEDPRFLGTGDILDNLPYRGPLK